MNDELKECPFCGMPANPNGIQDSHLVWCYFVARTAVVGMPDAVERVNVAWNRRPIEDALRARVAELEAALEEIAEGEMERARSTARAALERKP